ncbi:hypothetical protein [Mycobacterium sp. NPDC050041]|uniref:hypothetical protein n=1 Tax=Mycobacterium sp. NPDC050041 TaxID=3364293 RepID=UPI003C2F454B
MTIPLFDPQQSMHQQLWQLVGAFAHVQVLLDQLASAYFLLRMPLWDEDSDDDPMSLEGLPGVAGFVMDKVVKNGRDEDRPRLFQRIAKELGTDAELGDFNGVFSEVKVVRDLAAHGVSAEPVGSDRLRLTRSPLDIFVSPNKVKELELTRTELAAAVHKCRWLEAQVLYVAFTDLNPLPDPAEPPPPATTPGNWSFDPTQWAVLKPTRLPGDWDGKVSADQ